MKSCRVTVRDTEGIAHTVEVTAATLYEAVALGLKHIRGDEWVEGLTGPMTTVIISVRDVQVEHTVRIGEFTKWLERTGGSPAEVTRRRKIKEILGIPPASR